MSIIVNGTTNVITGASGIEIIANTVNTGTLDVTGDTSVATSKFTVAAATGNTVVAGTLAVNGATLSTDDVAFTAFAGATTSLTIGGTGETAVVAIPGTLDWSTTTGALTVAGGVYIAKKLQVISDFSVNTNKFNVAGTTGNVTGAGTVTITSADAAALSIGRLGATTPAFVIDASAGTAITGVKLTAGAAGGGVALLAVGETNVALSLNGAGNGAMTLNTTSTGLTTLGNATGGCALAGAVTLTRSTDSASETVGLSVADTRTGAGATGWGIKGNLISNVALGSYANGVYGILSFGGSGAVTGLAAGVCAEILLGAGCTAGTYAGLEIEFGMDTSAVTGTDSSFMYLSLYGAAKATFDTNGYFFQLAGVTKNTGKLLADTTSGATARPVQALKCKTPDGIRYLPLYDTVAIAA